MKVELQTDSPQECRALPARSIGSYHDGESSCRLFYVDPEGTASEKQAEGVEASNQDEDNIVRELALGAMIRFRKRLSNSRLTRNSEGALSETRITGEFSIMSTGVLPCTAHELTHVLSPDNTDRWNASMVELFGHDYSYGVKVRSLAMGSGEETHLSIKIIHFRSLSHTTPFPSLALGGQASRPRGPAPAEAWLVDNQSRRPRPAPTPWHAATRGSPSP